MKVLVTYSSKTGNTKKVAISISKAIENSKLLDISDVDTLDYDLIILGTWIDRATADAKAMEFIKQLKNKNVAFFFTLGAYPNSEHAKDCVKNITNLFEENGNNILGHYFCQGAIDQNLIEMMKSFPENHPHAPTPERIKRWEEAKLHPNEEDLQKAYRYFKKLI